MASRAGARSGRCSERAGGHRHATAYKPIYLACAYCICAQMNSLVTRRNTSAAVGHAGTQLSLCPCLSQRTTTQHHPRTANRSRLLKTSTPSPVGVGVVPRAAGSSTKGGETDTSGSTTTSKASKQQNVVVRPVQPADKQAWWSLFRAYISWYKATVSDEVIELTWQRMMAGGEGAHQGLLAVDASSGKVLGLAHLLLHRSTWSSTHYAYLEDLFVTAEVRGGGVGEALIEAVYSSADQQGCTKTYWQTHEMNYRARGLYDKMGRKSAFILYERT